MQHGDGPKGLFLRRVGNQIFTHRNEAQGPSGKVGASVALIREWNQSANPGKDFLAHTAGGEGIAFRDIFPNLGDVLRRKRVKAKALLRRH